MGFGFRRLEGVVSVLFHRCLIRKFKVEKLTKSQTNTLSSFCITLDLSDFNTIEVGKLLAWWIKLERFIVHCFNFCTENRGLLTGCLDPAAAYTAQRVYACIVLQSHKLIVDASFWASNKTIKFYIKEDSAEKGAIYNWVRFLLFFVDTAKTLKMPDNLFWLLKKHDIYSALNITSLNFFCSDCANSVKEWIEVKHDRVSNKILVAR